jgi:hypothetical protein
LARRADDDELAEWRADTADLLARLDAGALEGGDPDATREYLNWQLGIIDAERALRERIKTGRASPPTEYPREALTQIRRRINLVHIMENRGVALRRSGNTWRGACLFCRADNPTTPTIWRAADGAEHFRCWRCGRRGDVFTAVQALDRLPFWQCVEGLAAVADVELPPRRAPARPAQPAVGVRFVRGGAA